MKECRGFLAAAAFDEIEDVEMLGRLLRQSAAIDGDMVFDQPPEPIDALQRIQKKAVA